MDDHACAYREVERWNEWVRVESRRERAATRVPICDVCGRERPARPDLRPHADAIARSLELIHSAQEEVSRMTLITGRATAIQKQHDNWKAS